MPEHPFLLVDERQPKGRKAASTPDAHPRPLRAPVVLEREVLLSDDGFTLRLGTDVRGAVLMADGGLHRTSKSGKHSGGMLAVDEAFKVGRHPFRLARADALVVDPHRAGDYVLFNCFHAIGEETHWRAFRLDDPTRTILDWTPSAVLPSSFGVSLQRVGLANAVRPTHFDAPLARAAVDALLRGAQELHLMQTADVTLTWDGRAHVSASKAALPHEEDFVRECAQRSALLTARQLRGELVSGVAAHEQAMSAAAFDELARQTPASADALAVFLRELFPQAWAVERAVRERAAALDLSQLSTGVDAANGAAAVG